jgi:hypothetical protein
MTRHILAMALAALLSGNCSGRTQPSSLPSPREQMRMIHPESPAEVRFLDGSKLRGWIGEVFDSGFTLSHEKKGRLEKATVTFDQIRAVNQVESVKPGHTARDILIGVGIAVVAIGAVAGIGFIMAEK